MLYANITNHENSNPIEVPTEDDGTILLSTITGQYPGATSLNFCFNGKLRAISIMDGRLYAPEGGWGDMIYRCVFPEAKLIPTKKIEEAAAGPLLKDPVLRIDNKNLRRDFYVLWANSKSIGTMFSDAVSQIKYYLENYLIVINDESTKDPTEDILYSFIGKKNPILNINQFEELSIIPVDVTIYDHCLNEPLLISKDILFKYDRNAAFYNLKEIGYQHINMHNIVDSDSMSNSSSVEDFLDEKEPLKKKLKMCQRKTLMDCQFLLGPHQNNCTQLMYTNTKLEILILCPMNSVDICKRLASHLGLIFIEDVIDMMEGNVNKNEVLYQRTISKKAKFYCLIQSYVSRCLMLGHSNISLTCNVTIFQNLSSDVKCMIFNEPNDILFKTVIPFVHMTVKVKNDTLLEYMSAVSEIIDYTLAFEASIPAFYCTTDIEGTDKKYYKLKFPVLGIIPLYIIKFFAKKKFCETNVKKSLF